MTKTPRLISFCESTIKLKNSNGALPSLEYTQQILNLAIKGNLPDPQYIATAGGDDAIYFAMTSYSKSIHQLLDVDSPIGISIITGKAATVDNTETYNIKFLLKSKNWFVNQDAWSALGMTESTQDSIGMALSHIAETTCSVKHTTLNEEQIVSIFELS